MKAKIVITIILLFIAALPFGIYRHYFDKGDFVRVEIPQGASAGQIASILKENKIITSPFWFKVCTKLSGAGKLLRSGTFLLNENMASEEVIWRLTNDPGVELIKIIIPEGWRVEEIARELKKREIIDNEELFIQLTKERELEGKLFPSTYLFAKNTPITLVIKTMQNEYDKNISPIIKAIRSDFNENQILTLASIVEREATYDDERPKIAAVYINRYKIGKRLEADPTVQYALGYIPEENRFWKGRLLYRDLKLDNPYNTYRYNGLPPGPIANPGLNSIKAVLSPEEDFTALYFVADNTGRHVFSETYDQHINNIKTIRSK
ncbi:MAG: endolytic transglycosylase MltG [Elusimicrobiaceae bacterium]|nr:endolytic transglycosylase MltG [Elusimicrobiaceae bacterium]